MAQFEVLYHFVRLSESSHMPKGFTGLELWHLTECMTEPLAISPPLYDTTPLNFISGERTEAQPKGKREKEKKKKKSITEISHV